MNTKVHYILFISILGLTFQSCFKKVDYPLEPQITYEDFIIYGNNDSSQIAINFTDGDGNIGLLENDTAAPFNFNGGFYHNILLHYYEKDDALGWVKGLDVNNDPIIFKFRIKPVMPYDQSKGIKGIIKYSSNLFYDITSDNSDTIMYKIQIIDRDLNKSNFAETPEIILN